MNTEPKLARSHDIATKVSLLFRKRAEVAQEQFTRAPRAGRRRQRHRRARSPIPPPAPSCGRDWYSYAVDATQRSILFWDTLRQRGNNFVEHNQAGPAAGAALRLRDGRRRPQARRARSTTRWCASCRRRASRSIRSGARTSSSIRAPGHGPGIGGFKDDSQVGVALRDGPSGLLRHLLPRARAGPDAARRVRGRAAVRAQGARAASGEPEAGDRRQLPGRLGGDDARRLRSRRHRARS